MSDQPPQEETLETATGVFSEKLQALGKSLLSALYMLVRSVKLYDPENAVFVKPLTALQETINAIIAKDGKLELQGVTDTFYLNGMLVRLDATTLDNTRQLIAEMKAKDIGGLSLTRAVSQEELRNLIFLFARDKAQTSEEGALERKLVEIKLTRWSKIQEKLSKEDVSDEQVDRKKYALTVFARAIVFMRKVVEQVAKGNAPVLTPSGRIIQDLVDVAFEQRSHMLGLTSRGEEHEYIVYHHVNSALMSIVFGNELGLTRPQLRELGLIALFHELAAAAVPKELQQKTTALTDAENLQLALVPFETLKLILLEKNLSRETLQRIASVFEYRNDWGKKSKEPSGREVISQGTALRLYSRILSLCSTYDTLTSKRPQREALPPAVAISLMWGKQAHRFDPWLLKSFAMVMAQTRVKKFAEGQGVMNIVGI